MFTWSFGNWIVTWDEVLLYEIEADLLLTRAYSWLVLFTLSCKGKVMTNLDPAGKLF